MSCPSSAGVHKTERACRSWVIPPSALENHFEGARGGAWGGGLFCGCIGAMNKIEVNFNEEGIIEPSKSQDSAKKAWADVGTCRWDGRGELSRDGRRTCLLKDLQNRIYQYRILCSGRQGVGRISARPRKAVFGKILFSLHVLKSVATQDIWHTTIQSQ